ncbi:unnamed protein product [Brassica oleracea]
MELRTWGGGGFRALCVQWGEESRFSWDRDLHRHLRHPLDLIVGLTKITWRRLIKLVKRVSLHLHPLTSSP